MTEQVWGRVKDIHPAEHGTKLKEIDNVIMYCTAASKGFSVEILRSPAN